MAVLYSLLKDLVVVHSIFLRWKVSYNDHICMFFDSKNLLICI